MSKFKINTVSEAYKPENQTEPSFLIEPSLNSKSKNDAKNTKLYIKPKAIKQIFEHISWGQTTKENVVEQGGVLLGKVFFDEKKNLMYGVVEEALAGKEAKGSSAYLEMDHEVWKEMLDEFDAILDKDEDKQWQMIGWYHTHPNNLSVFMSGTDMGTQQRFFSNDWQYAIIFNPHKQIWKSFVGNEAVECAGMIVKD